MDMTGTAISSSSGLIDTVLIVWFTLTALSVAYVAWDAWANNPELGVMKVGWVLVTLYIGPVGLALYILACKEPAPGQHETFISPLWKQALGSTIHCMAGDATGIIVAAAITMTLGLPMWLDTISEYFFGFGVRPAHLPIAFHEEHNGRLIPGRRPALFHAGVALNERGHGRHDTYHGDIDEQRYDLYGGDFAPLLGRDVSCYAGWYGNSVSRERMVGGKGPEARNGYCTRPGQRRA